MNIYRTEGDRSFIHVFRKYEATRKAARIETNFRLGFTIKVKSRQTATIKHSNPPVPQTLSLNTDGFCCIENSHHKFSIGTLTADLYPVMSSRNSHKLTKSDVKKLHINYTPDPIPPEAKEIHFKLISAIYPSSECLYYKFNIGQNFFVAILKEHVY